MKQMIVAGILACQVACASLPSTPSISEVSDDTAVITNLLSAQKNAWNAGSIDAFMDGYWRSPDLRFASGGKVTTGWRATLDRYRENYADRSKMGLLDFSGLYVNQLSPDAAIVHGRWKLTRMGDNPHGLFTLVLRKIDGRWFIVSDTTTSGGS